MREGLLSRFCLVVCGLFCCGGVVHAQEAWSVGTWAASPVAAKVADAGKADETMREVVHVSLAGREFASLVLTNEFGTEPLTIGAASLGLHGVADEVKMPVSVTFGGKPGVVIPPGGMVESDQVHFAFPAMSDVVVSLFVPAQTIGTVSQHGFADGTNYVGAGDQTAALTLTDSRKIGSWRFLKGVRVSTGTDVDLVCLGDSITDGSKSTADANRRWPDLLAARLPGGIGVLNEGIGGNRILHEVTGPSALARFDRDVLNLGHVKYLIILEGINDIGHAYDPKKPYDVVSADELIAADRLMVARAHAHGIKVFGATLTPYVGAGYSSPAGEVVRTALNQWIRTSKELDGVIDFDKATRDPANPSMFLPAYDSGDHLHPNDAGMRGMADAIDLKLFAK